MNRIAALVPMRHDSQRVKGKNYRLLAGRPLYQHILLTLQACPEIDDIIVDTDSQEIMRGVQEHFPSVKLIERPEHLRADTVPMNEVLMHDTNQVQADFYLQTHSTNPLLRPQTVSQAILELLENYPAYDSLFSVTRLQTRLWDQLGRAINHNPAILLRTQDLPPVYEENSCIYIFTRDTLLVRRNRLGERPLMFEIDADKSWDIDEEIDFLIADILKQKALIRNNLKEESAVLFLIHVILIAIYPPLALLANNITDVLLPDAARAVIFSLALALVLLLFLRLIVKNWQRASLVCTGFIILIFSYGHVYTLLKKVDLFGFHPARNGLLLPAWLILGSVWFWWVVKKLGSPVNLIKFFNIVGAVLLVLPIYKITSFELRSAHIARAQSSTAVAIQEVQSQNLPDIYYIILDGYARADLLKEIFGYDNSSFIHYLEQRGFYVAEQGHSNYNQTALSLGSSLSMDYLDDVAKQMGPGETNDRSPLEAKIRQSHILELLRPYGYKLVAFQTGYGSTQIYDADLYWKLNNEPVPPITAFWRLNPFESLFIESTVMRTVFDLNIFSADAVRHATLYPEYQFHRDRILYTLNKLEDVAKLDGNYFVFAHILAPHPPFVFGPNGEAINPPGGYKIGDGDQFAWDLDTYLTGYPNQVTFINSQVEKTVDRILALSKTPPVIILQGDHGSGTQLIWESPERSNVKERFSILNAYYFPGGDNGLLYPTITPVNTFRVLMNRFFNASLPLLEDRSYFATWTRPYDFTDVTGRLNTR